MKNSETTYKNRIARYLSGDCNNRERIELEKWIEQSEENKRIFNQYAKLWAIEPALNITPVDTENAWNKVSAKLSLPGDDARSIAATTTRKLSLTHYLSGIAATLLLLFGLYFLLRSDQPAEIQIFANNNTSEPMLLPDNSQVFLNSGSSLSFPEKFTGKTRWVTLSGEAFFVVATDASKPFVINTGETEVKVIGTSFNVAQRKSTNTTEVAVLTGKVVFYPAADPGNKLILQQGEMGIFGNSGLTLHKQQLDNANFMAWKTGLLEFDQTPLTIVIATLERAFGISIEVNRSVADLKLTARFSNDTPEDIFETLALIFGFETERQGEKFIIN